MQLLLEQSKQLAACETLDRQDFSRTLSACKSAWNIIFMKNTSSTCFYCYFEGEHGQKLKYSEIYLEEKGSPDNLLFCYVVINVYIFTSCLSLETQTENETSSYEGYPEFLLRLSAQSWSRQLVASFFTCQIIPGSWRWWKNILNYVIRALPPLMTVNEWGHTRPVWKARMFHKRTTEASLNYWKPKEISEMTPVVALWYDICFCNFCEC